MTYGTIKVDTVTFTDAGIDKSVTLSGLVQNPTFSGNVTVTGTLSGVTVTGTTANFTSGNFTNISGGTHTITSGVFAAGSAASPSITFTGDLNTGIYSPGADQVAISTGGSGRLFVDANGNVGLNTASITPVGDYRFLAINGAGTGGGAVVSFRNTSAGEGAFASYNPGASFNVGSIQSIPLIFTTNNSEKLRITSAGLVGVGTSSPSDTLQINKTGAGGVKVVSTTQSTIYFSNAAGTGGYIIGRSIGSDNAHNLFSYDATNSHYVDYFEGGSGGYRSFYTNGTERLRITSAGLVGIGTVPAAWSAFTALQIKDSSVSSTGGDLNLMANAYYDGANYRRIGSTGAGRQYFNTDGSITWQQAGSGSAGSTISFSTPMTLDSSGRLGIGTTGPAGQLQVNGQDIYLTSNGAVTDNRIRFSFFNFTGNSVGAALGYTYRIANTQESGSLVFYTNPNSDGTGSLTERARIDSSGRLLVGTSSYSGDGTIVARGSSAGAATQSFLVLQRGQTSPAPDLDLGVIRFTDAAESLGAQIAAQTDGSFAWGANDYPTRLVFSVSQDGSASPTERLRISNDGRASTFCSSTTNSLALAHAAGAGTTYKLIEGAYGATGVNTGTESFRVYTNGNVQNTNNSYTAISDIKLKENIVDAGPQWDDIKALQVRNYNLKEGQTHRQIGLIAQEVEPISPGLVYESPDRDADGNDLGTVTKSVNYSVLYMKAVKALQEAMERIEQLEAEMAEVKAQLS